MIFHQHFLINTEINFIEKERDGAKKALSIQNERYKHCPLQYEFHSWQYTGANLWMRWPLMLTFLRCKIVFWLPSIAVGIITLDFASNDKHQSLQWIPNSFSNNWSTNAKNTNKNIPPILQDTMFSRWLLFCDLKFFRHRKLDRLNYQNPFSFFLS